MARRRIEVEIIGNERDLVRAFGRSSAAAQGFGARMDRIGRGMARTGRTLTSHVTLPVVGLGIAAGRMSDDFEKSMTNIRALVGASAQQMAEYEEGVLALARTVPQGPQALADALYFVTSAGFEGASAMRVLEASAQAAAAGLGDTTQVADVVTSAVNVYGESVLKASDATDVLLATVREGKAEPEELAEVLGRVIAPAEALGVSFGEVGGAVAGLTLGGLDAAEAVTGLRGTLATLLKPSKQARDLLEDAGMSIDAIRESVADKGLLPTLQKLRERFGDNQDALGKLFPNVRALNAFLSLTGRNAEKNADAMRAVEKATGDTSRAFAEAAESDGFKVRRAWSSIRADLIEAGDQIVPAFANVMSSVAGLASAFGDLDSGTQSSIIVLALLAAAVGPVVSLVGNAIIAVKGLATALLFVGGSPVMAAVVGLALLGGALLIARDRTDAFSQATDRARTQLEGLADATKEAQQADLDRAGSHVRLRQASTALKDAEDALAQARKSGTPREVERAENGLAAARYNVKVATAQARDADARYSAARKKANDETARARRQVKDLHDELLDKLIPASQRTTRAIYGNRVEQDRLNKLLKPDAVRKYADTMDELGDKSLDTGAKMEATNPKIARLAAKTSHAAGAAAALARSLGRIPRKVEVELWVHRFNVVTNVEENRLSGVGRKHQTGVSNSPGGMALVGELGPELVRLPRGADVLPSQKTRALLRGPQHPSDAGVGGGTYELVITNWPEGRGYIRELAGGVVKGNARSSRQRERMGA